MKKKPQRTKLRVNDVVVCHWLDTVSYGRTSRPDKDLILAEFVTYGIISHIDDRRIVIRTEEEVTPTQVTDEGEYRKVVEPVLVPLGCIYSIKVMRPAGEAYV